VLRSGRIWSRLFRAEPLYTRNPASEWWPRGAAFAKRVARSARGADAESRAIYSPYILITANVIYTIYICEDSGVSSQYNFYLNITKFYLYYKIMLFHFKY